ncbi:MAG: prephenate dehydratase [Candidatus Thioglobus sp.]|nr:MAG: prephenate dehydratase [Candidatus Thioglobus sp.]KAA0453503.1 MAG: prephenate dehydratase [Candidatus Thioglobus sp.]
MAKKLSELRFEIDKLDKQIQIQIGERAELALAIAKIKKSTKDQSSFYRPEREAQVLREIIKRNDSAIKDQDMAHIFREIMSACLALEQQIKVAYLGPEGTFTQEAALKYFGNAVQTLACNSIDSIFQQVAKGDTAYGVVPIENSSNGVIGRTIDMLYAQDLKICGEIEIAIHHQLMMADSAKKIKVIYAHQQSIEQCQGWIWSNYPGVELKAVASNALAARMVKDQPNAAAIASEAALGLYELQKVAKNIEDQNNNVTRFLVIGNEDIQPSGADKTSLLVVTKHEPGALFELLAPFKNHNINILQLDRHPLPEVKWEYLFLVNIAGHQQQDGVQKALAELENNVIKMRVLGSYPLAVL